MSVLFFCGACAAGVELVLKGGGVEMQRTREGDGKLAALAKEAGLRAGNFLEPDPELDPPDLPSAADWLKQEDLQSVPV